MATALHDISETTHLLIDMFLIYDFFTSLATKIHANRNYIFDAEHTQNADIAIL